MFLNIFLSWSKMEHLTLDTSPRINIFLPPFHNQPLFIYDSTQISYPLHIFCVHYVFVNFYHRFCVLFSTLHHLVAWCHEVEFCNYFQGVWVTDIFHKRYWVNNIYNTYQFPRKKNLITQFFILTILYVYCIGLGSIKSRNFGWTDYFGWWLIILKIYHSKAPLWIILITNLLVIMMLKSLVPNPQ